MNRQFLTSVLAVGAVAVGTFGSMTAAEAATLVQNGGGTVTGINGLSIGNADYNVAFKNANFTSTFTAKGLSPTFLGSVAGASSAVTAINDFLTAESKFGSVFLGNANDFLVAYGIIQKDTRKNSNQPSKFEDFVQAAKGTSGASSWSLSLVEDILVNGGGNQPVYAVFSAVPSTPVPTPALLPGLIGMGVAAMRKKKQAQEQVQEA